MQVFKRLSKATIGAFLVVEITGFTFAAEVHVYDYNLKRNVRFSGLLTRTSRVLVIKEDCSACESLLKKIPTKKRNGLIFGILEEPSFKWIAKLKKVYPTLTLHNIDSLELNIENISPALLIFGPTGKLKETAYGQRNTLRRLTN